MATLKKAQFDNGFEVFFDGQCPICAREIEMIRRMDTAQTITLTDIAQPEFAALENGLSFHRLSRAIHARFPGNDTQPERWIAGVDVFREIYNRLGFNRLVAVSRLPLVRSTLNAGYQIFAYFRYRLAIRRIRNLATSAACRDDRCRPFGEREIKPVTAKWKYK